MDYFTYEIYPKRLTCFEYHISGNRQITNQGRQKLENIQFFHIKNYNYNVRKHSYDIMKTMLFIFTQLKLLIHEIMNFKKNILFPKNHNIL